MNPDFFDLRFSRTLWEGVYRGYVLNEEGMQIASLRILPCLPLAPEELPPNAPDAGPVILVMVDLAEMDPKDFLSWENAIALKVLAQFSHQEPIPRECQFFYPSPIPSHPIE